MVDTEGVVRGRVDEADAEEEGGEGVKGPVGGVYVVS